MHDNHIHSKFSTDSHMDAEEACKRAVEIGLKGLVFTDHVDYDYPDFDESFLIDYNEYFPFLINSKISGNQNLKYL